MTLLPLSKRCTSLTKWHVFKEPILVVVPNSELRRLSSLDCRLSSKMQLTGWAHPSQSVPYGSCFNSHLETPACPCPAFTTVPPENVVFVNPEATDADTNCLWETWAASSLKLTPSTKGLPGWFCQQHMLVLQIKPCKSKHTQLAKQNSKWLIKSVMSLDHFILARKSVAILALIHASKDEFTSYLQISYTKILLMLLCGILKWHIGVSFKIYHFKPETLASSLEQKQCSGLCNLHVQT